MEKRKLRMIWNKFASVMGYVVSALFMLLIAVILTYSVVCMFMRIGELLA